MAKTKKNYWKYYEARNQSKQRMEKIKIYHPMSRRDHPWAIMDFPQPPSPKLKYLMVIVPRELDPDIFNGRLPVTYDMAAKILGVTRNTLAQYVTHKVIKAIGTTPGLIFWDDILAYLEHKMEVRYSVKGEQKRKEITNRLIGKGKMNLSTGSQNIEFDDDSIPVVKSSIRHYTKEELEKMGVYQSPQQDFSSDLKPQEI